MGELEDRVQDWMFAAPLEVRHLFSSIHFVNFLREERNRQFQVSNAADGSIAPECHAMMQRNSRVAGAMFDCCREFAKGPYRTPQEPDR